MAWTAVVKQLEGLRPVLEGVGLDEDAACKHSDAADGLCRRAATSVVSVFLVYSFRS